MQAQAGRAMEAREATLSRCCCCPPWSGNTLPRQPATMKGSVLGRKTKVTAHRCFGQRFDSAQAPLFHLRSDLSGGCMVSTG